MYVLVVNHREEPVGKKGFFLVPFPFGFCFTWTHFNEHKTFVGFVVNFMLTLEEKFFFFFSFFIFNYYSWKHFFTLPVHGAEFHVNSTENVTNRIG